MTKGETIYTHVKYALKFKVSSIISSNFCFLADEVLRKVAGDRLIFLWRAFILFLQPAFTGAIFVSIFFSVKGAPMRDTCQTNLIEERFEGFSTVRYSYLAESTGTCRDQVDPTLCHGEKLRFEEK